MRHIENIIEFIGENFPFIILGILVLAFLFFISLMISSINQENKRIERYMRYSRVGVISEIVATTPRIGQKQFHIKMKIQDKEEISFFSSAPDFIGKNGLCVLVSNGIQEFTNENEGEENPLEFIGNFGEQKQEDCFLIGKAINGMTAYYQVNSFVNQLHEKGIVPIIGIVSEISKSVNGEGYKIKMGEKELYSYDDSFAGVRGKCLKVMTLGDQSVVLENFGEISPEKCSSIASASNEEVIFQQTVTEKQANVSSPIEEKRNVIADDSWSIEKCSDKRNSLMKEQEDSDSRYFENLEALFASKGTTDRENFDRETLINSNCQGENPTWEFEKCSYEGGALEKKREQDDFQYSQKKRSILDQKRTSDRIRFKKEEQIDKQCQ